MNGTSWDKMSNGEKACLCENVAMTPFYWGMLCAAGALTDREKVLVLRKQTLTPRIFDQIYSSLGSGAYRLLADISEAKVRKDAVEAGDKQTERLAQRVAELEDRVETLSALLDIAQHSLVDTEQKTARHEDQIGTMKNGLSILTDCHHALRSSVMNHLFSHIEGGLKAALARLFPRDTNNPYGAGIFDGLFGKKDKEEEPEVHGRQLEVEMKPVVSKKNRRLKEEGEPAGRSKTGVVRDKDPRSQARSGTHRKFKALRDGKQQCSRCKEWKTPDFFHRDQKASTGLTSFCADCARKNTREHTAALKKASL